MMLTAGLFPPCLCLKEGRGRDIAMNKCGVFIFLSAILLLTGCHGAQPEQNIRAAESMDTAEDGGDTAMMEIVPAEEIMELEDGFSAVRYNGNYGFEEFLSGGGAASDREVMEFLARNLLGGLDLGFVDGIFGCSTLAVKNPEGEVLFGRNFDWNSCDAMVVMSYPENAYASISTVNMDFIRQGAGGAAGLALKADSVRTLAALYAPLDGMNEKGFAVSVNMIQDSASIDQNTGKPDITTTTAIRLLLDKAADVEEALELLGQYDLHGSMGMMVHFAMADTSGKSVAVEYIGNQMIVTETPAVTNFYLAEGERHGIGTEQSHQRYEILMDALEENASMDEGEVRDILDRVSKDNFGEFESTEWSIVFNLNTGKASYYHREDYTKGYAFSID